MAQTPEQARAWYVANRERVLAQQKIWRQANRDKVAAQAARRYARDPEAARTQARARYHANRERGIARMSEYREQNRGYFQAKAAERRAQVGEGDLTAQQWQSILEEFDYRCAYCQAGGSLQLEHMTPLSRGGRNTFSNVVPACAKCNKAKFTRTIFEFLAIA